MRLISWIRHKLGICKHQYVIKYQSTVSKSKKMRFVTCIYCNKLRDYHFVRFTEEGVEFINAPELNKFKTRSNV